MPASPGSSSQTLSPAAIDVDDERTRRIYLGVLSIALCWLLFWYRDTFMSMVEIWDRSDTYAHGFVVAPISAWLIWRRRDFLRGLPITPSVLGVAAGALAGSAWLLGELASVASVSQFALVGMIISLVWAVMGNAVARAYAFPLGFLFFLVPFGEFLFPTMMDWTAHFVIGALRLSGVPVYAEGHSLVIPSGSWQVVEGCSGVRYLIASVVVGSLYAYLNYRSLSKRILFIAASIIVPVFANWLRAYGIVMLGHVSDNRIATGVDHIVYGWVFFGIVILALFWIGSRWQEDEEHAPAARSALSLTGSASDSSVWSGRRAAWLAVALVAVLAWNPLLGYLDRQGQHGSVELARLTVGGEWQPAQLAELPEWTPRYQGMRAQAQSAWTHNGKPVGFYIAYFRDQGPQSELINSENRIILNKDPLWTLAGTGTANTHIGQQSVTVLSTEVRNPEGRLLIWHLYWIGGRWTGNEYVAKAYGALARLSGRGDDSAMVAVYAPAKPGHQGAAAEQLSGFLSAMGPQVEAILESAMER